MAAANCVWDTVMADLINYYQILRVPSDVDLAGIQNAYARLSREFAGHLQHDEARKREMQQLNEAYEVLADPQLRVEYDRQLYAEEYDAFYARWRRAILKQRANHWAVLGVLAVLVLAEGVTLALFGYSNLGAIGSVFTGAWSDIVSAGEWVTGHIKDANASLGNPISWFGELADSIKKAAG